MSNVTRSSKIINPKGEELTILSNSKNKSLVLTILGSPTSDEARFYFESAEELDDFIKALFKLRTDI